MEGTRATCCARDCSTILTDSPPNCYQFPEEHDLIREILVVIERHDLISLPIEELRNNYLVCMAHFKVVGEEPVEPERVVNHGSMQASNYQYQDRQGERQNEVVNRQSYHQKEVQSHSRQKADRSGTSERHHNRDSPYPHSGGRPNKDNIVQSCKVCYRVLVGFETFKNHMLSYHQDFFCTRCNTPFKSGYYLRTHQLNHCTKRHMYEWVLLV